MQNYTIGKRAFYYNIAFPNYPALNYTDRWLYGMWLIGNNYKGSGYYGSYPPGYKKRILSMFPDVENLLHLFSGSLSSEEVKNDAPTVVTFDIASNDIVKPDIKGDAEKLAFYFKEEEIFDLIMADPPYSEEDANKYGTCMINRNKVVKECVKILKPGGFLVWLDQVLPMYRKQDVKLIGTIGIIRSTNHRFRVVCIFQKN